MELQKQRRRIIPTVFAIVFLDLLGLGIIIPVLAPIFLDPVNGIFDPSVSLAVRTTSLGLVMAIYPIMQFFGAPMLGALSDRFGRRPTLILSLLGTFIGYILFAFGATIHSLTLLVLSRALDGFTGGNISTAHSVITDISDNKSKAKDFGLLGMAFGLGFVAGPSIGGLLADRNLVSWFSYSTPFIAAAILCGLTIIGMIIFLPETLKVKSHVRIDAFTGFRNLGKAIHMPGLRGAFFALFLFGFGFNFFAQFFQVYAVVRFHMTPSNIGMLFAFIGVSVALVQGLILRPLVHVWSPHRLAAWGLPILSIGLILVLAPSNPMYLYAIMPLIALGNGLAQPNIMAVISNAADRSSQGEIMGIAGSMNAIAMALPPLIAGYIASKGTHLPLLAASGIVAVSWIVFLIGTRRKKMERIFHEA